MDLGFVDGLKLKVFYDIYTYALHNYWVKDNSYVISVNSSYIALLWHYWRVCPKEEVYFCLLKWAAGNLAYGTYNIYIYFDPISQLLALTYFTISCLGGFPLMLLG